MSSWPDPQGKLDMLIGDRRSQYVVNNELKAFDIAGKTVPPHCLEDVFKPGVIAVFDAKLRV